MTTISGPNKTKARKRHRCDYCQYHIDAGDIYLRSTHAYEGDIYNWKSHKHCNDIANMLKMFEQCDEGLTSDDFQECIINEYYNLDGPKLPYNTDFKVYLDFVLSHHLSITQ